MRIDDLAFRKLQIKIWEADSIFNGARRKFRNPLLTYKLRYTNNSYGHDIEDGPLEDLFIFRTKLKSINPLPPSKDRFLKILRMGPKKEWIEIDDAIYPQILNSCREILFNEGEKLFYRNILGMYKKALSGHDKDWQLEAFDEEGNNISNQVVRSYIQEEKIFNSTISKGDFDFIYNSVLQHSDERFRERYIREVKSGELFFSLYKSALLAEKIREIMVLDTDCFDVILQNRP